MGDTSRQWKTLIVRGAIPALVTIVTGYAIFRSQIFVSTMKASQFVLSGMTSGLAFGFFKSTTVRNAMAALFVWYLLAMLLIENFNSWNLILNGTYIIAVAAAVYVQILFARRSLVRTPVQRIAAAGVLVALANGVVILLFGLATPARTFSHPGFWLDAILFNLQIGTLIGLAAGFGGELAEWLVEKYLVESDE
jgi:hypothetical protein